MKFTELPTHKFAELNGSTPVVVFKVSNDDLVEFQRIKQKIKLIDEP